MQRAIAIAATAAIIGLVALAKPIDPSPIQSVVTSLPNMHELFSVTAQLGGALWFVAFVIVGILFQDIEKITKLLHVNSSDILIGALTAAALCFNAMVMSLLGYFPTAALDAHPIYLTFIRIIMTVVAFLPFAGLVNERTRFAWLVRVTDFKSLKRMHGNLYKVFDGLVIAGTLVNVSVVSDLQWRLDADPEGLAWSVLLFIVLACLLATSGLAGSTLLFATEAHGAEPTTDQGHHVPARLIPLALYLLAAAVAVVTTGWWNLHISYQLWQAKHWIAVGICSWSAFFLLHQIQGRLATRPTSFVAITAIVAPIAAAAVLSAIAIINIAFAILSADLGLWYYVDHLSAVAIAIVALYLVYEIKPGTPLLLESASALNIPTTPTTPRAS
jgi:hypothetical protein